MSDVKFSVFSQHPFIDLNLYQSGYEKCDPLHLFGPAKRDHYLFHYVLSGKGKLTSRKSDGTDETYEIGPGQGFIIFPGQVGTYIADEEEPWEYAWIEFDGMIAKEAIMLAGLTPDKPIYHSRDLALTKELEKLLVELSDSTDQSPYWKIGRLYLFIDNLNNSSKDKPILTGERMSDYYIKEISNYIEQHYNEDITVESMAEYLNLSRGYLNKIFKRYTGKSPKEFLTSYRMAKAIQLLKTTQIPIGEVGQRVGYANQLHFSRAFKNFFGVSPKIWRQMNKQLKPGFPGFSCIVISSKVIYS